MELLRRSIPDIVVGCPRFAAVTNDKTPPKKAPGAKKSPAKKAPAKKKPAGANDAARTGPLA